MNCGKFFGLDAVLEADGVPKCSCGGTIKPDVVLYEEGLDGQTVSGAIAAIQNADLLVVGGTSLTVYPAAGMIDYFRGDKLILINKTVTPFDSRADIVINESLGSVFKEILETNDKDFCSGRQHFYALQRRFKTVLVGLCHTKEKGRGRKTR